MNTGWWLRQTTTYNVKKHDHYEATTIYHEKKTAQKLQQNPKNYEIQRKNTSITKHDRPKGYAKLKKKYRNLRKTTIFIIRIGLINRRNFRRNCS